MIDTLFLALVILALLLPLGVLLFGLGWLLRGLRAGSETDALRYRAQRAEDELAAAGGGKDGAKLEADLAACVAKRKELEKQVTTLSSGDSAASELQKVTAERDSYSSQLNFLKGNLEKSAAYASGELESDDLTKIKGVAKVLNAKLNAFGIFSYRQIVEWDDSERSAFSELLGFGDRVTRDGWVEQASEFHKEKYGKAI